MVSAAGIASGWQEEKNRRPRLPRIVMPYTKLGQRETDEERHFFRNKHPTMKPFFKSKPMTVAKDRWNPNASRPKSGTSQSHTPTAVEEDQFEVLCNVGSTSHKWTRVFAHGNLQEHYIGKVPTASRLSHYNSILNQLMRGVKGCS